MGKKRAAAAVAIVMVLASGAAHAVRSARAIDQGEVSGAAESGRTIQLDLPGHGPVTLRVHEHSLWADDVRFTVTGPDGMRDVPRPAVRTFAGTVDGDPDGVVRLTTTDEGVTGFVTTRGEWFWIEPDGSIHRDTDTTLSFDGDVQETPASHAGTEVSAFGTGNCVVQSCGELTALVVLDGDKSFTALGVGERDCFDRQMAVLNNVDGIYRATGTRIKLLASQQNCRTEPDLGTTSTSAQTLIENLRLAWANQGKDRSLVFLFVGYDMPAAIAGIAYRPGVCGRLEPESVEEIPQRCEFGFSLGQMVGSVGTTDLKTKVMAHEIGHNFGAFHDDTGCGGAGYLMCPSLQSGGPQVFSGTSSGQIRAHAESTIGYIARL